MSVACPRTRVSADKNATIVGIIIICHIMEYYRRCFGNVDIHYPHILLLLYYMYIIFRLSRRFLWHNIYILSCQEYCWFYDLLCTQAVPNGRTLYKIPPLYIYICIFASVTCTVRLGYVYMDTYYVWVYSYARSLQ